MERPIDHSRPSADAATRPEDIDPWSEFLSESDGDPALSDSATSEASEPGEATELASSPPSNDHNASDPSSTSFEATDSATSLQTPREPVRLTVVELNPPVAAPADPLPPLFRPIEDVTAVDHASRHDADDLGTHRDARQEGRSLPGPAHVSRFVRRGESFGSPQVATRAYESDEETTFARALQRDEPPPLPVPPGVEAPRESGRPLQPLFSGRRRLAAAAPVPGCSISLYDVVSRQTPVQWSEAVAVVQAVCVAVDADEEPPCIPELEDVFITDAGEVAMSPDGHGDSDIASLGRLLHALLVNATTPLPLRLFVTSASSSDRYRSVALFADALGYYAAPGRTELIQSLYQRAMETEPVSAPPGTAGDAVAPPPSILNKGVSWSVPLAPRRRKVPTWAVAAGVGVVLGGAVSVVLLRSGIGVPRTEAAVEASGSTASTSGAAAPGAVTVPRDDWQLGRIVVQGRDAALNDRNIQPPPQASPARSSPPAAAADAAPAVSLPSAPVPAAPAAPVVAAPPADHTPAPTATPVPARPQQPSTPVTSPRLAANAAAFQDPTIYTEADRDVEAPVMLSAETLPLAPLGPNDTQLETILELVINPQGRVQKAQLKKRSERMDVSFLIQSAKLLKFEPARKNGRPVSYRYTLRVLTTPR
jgi:hypothetical protein